MRDSTVTRYVNVRKLVSWCYEPCQLLRITSGLKTNFNPSFSYPVHKSLNIHHNFAMTQLKYFT